MEKAAKAALICLAVFCLGPLAACGAESAKTQSAGVTAFSGLPEETPASRFTEEDGCKYIEDSLGYKEEVSYTGVEGSLGFYEYESEARFYSIDPISGEVMTLISKDLTPLFENISADPLENAKAFIEEIDEKFFKIGAREEMTKLDNGEISIVFESLAAEDIGNGRTAGVRMDANGNIISLAFSISSAEAEENAQKAAKETITADEAVKLAIAAAGEEYDAAQSGTEFDFTDAEVSSRMSFWRGRQVWVVEIDQIETSDNTELRYCCRLDAVTGEIVFSDRSR